MPCKLRLNHLFLVLNQWMLGLYNVDLIYLDYHLMLCMTDTLPKLSFKQAFQLFFLNFANFKGRSTRAAYWWWMLASFLIGGIGAPLLDLVFFDVGYENYGLFGGLWALITLIPNFSLTIRRLHDSNRSGWWQLLILTIIGIIPLLWWIGISPSTQGTNKYGDQIEAGLDHKS